MYGRMFSVGRNKDYDHGLRLFDQGLYEAAILELEKVIALPDDQDAMLVKLANFYLAESWSFLGSYALGQRLLTRAASCFEEALKRNPGYADLHYKLSTVYLQQDKPSEADAEVDLALEINPRFAKALIQSGVCKYKLGEPAKAIEAIAKGVQCDISMNNEVSRQGFTAHRLGHFDLAQQHFAHLITNETDEVAYNARLGADFFRRGMLDEASLAFEKALDISPNYADLHNSLGMTYHSAGKSDLAIKEFNKALDINPNYEEAKRNLELASLSAGISPQPKVHLELVEDSAGDEQSSI